MASIRQSSIVSLRGHGSRENALPQLGGGTRDTELGRATTTHRLDFGCGLKKAIIEGEDARVMPRGLTGDTVKPAAMPQTATQQSTRSM